jgi:rod shape determining protein RodA
MKKKFFKNVEWYLIIAVIMLSAVGLVALFSATHETGLEEFQKQIIWIVIGVILLIVLMFIDYELIAKISPVFYAISIILLIAVLFTKSINGATSWFEIAGFSFQPAEFAKIFVILFLSFAITKLQQKGKEEINKFHKLLISILIVAVPVALIILQPDYGTATAYIFILAFILLVAGLRKSIILATVIIAVISVPLIYNFVLPAHAKNRIDTFLNPELDARGSGYNIIQSKLAIGSGELLGMGILKGNQTQLGYLYPKTTDFIYSVIGEEMGFVMTAGIVIVYVFLINKILFVAKTAKDDLGSYIASGIAGMFLFHMLENIGMTIGMLPITGVPLLFISYGGSSTIMSFICIGIVLNISGNRQKSLFVK